MKSIIKPLFISLLFFQLSLSKASHLVAGDISYTHISNNNYLVTLTLFRDCSGINMGAAQLTFQSSCGGFAYGNYPLVDFGEVNSYCSLTTTCNGGSMFGYQYYIYTDTITLTPCNNWQISYQECCRNPSGINVVNPSSYDFFISATLDNSVAPNSSPIFSHQPALFAVNGQPTCINNTAFDIDGDSLVYSLVAPKQNMGSSLVYNPGYSALSPFGSGVTSSFNPNTGNLCLPSTPMNIGGYIVAVKVEEYRSGVLIGSTTRDAQVIVFNQSTSSFVDINGVVTDVMGAPQSGITVELFEYDISEGTMPLQATATTNMLGEYSFAGVNRQQYILRAQTNNPLYLPTYHESTYYWNIAQLTYSFCDTMLNSDIELVSVLNPIGTGIIAGYLNGFGLRSGDPLEGVYVYLLDKNTGAMVAHAATTSNGYYEITNVPDGAYRMIVDIAGLLMQTTHYPVISGGNSISSQDYMATEDGIYATTFDLTSLNELHNDNLIGVFPNPGSNQLTITNREGKNMQIVMYDISGRRVSEKLLATHQLTISVEHLNTGTYFLVVTSSEYTETLKWLKQ